MDEWQYELAEKRSEEEKNNQIRQAHAALAPQFHPGFDGEHCVDCGATLPPLRITMGRVFCVECQELNEKRGR